MSTPEPLIEVLPPAAQASTDYAAGRITAAQYIEALRKAALEEQPPFRKTTWSKVEVGDVVLMSLGPYIVEAKVKRLMTRPAVRGDLIHAEFDSMNPHGYRPGDTVYVLQR